MGWFKRIKRAAVAVATGGFSETIKPMREGLKEVTGVNAMEDANDLAQKQYDEQKAMAPLIAEQISEFTRHITPRQIAQPAYLQHSIMPPHSAVQRGEDNRHPLWA